MQRPRFVSLGSALAFLVLLGNSAQGETDPLKGLDDYINKALKDWQVRGLALAIVKDDTIVVATGYGVRKLGETRPVDEHTLFAIGSATKALNAAPLAMLVAEGKIMRDAPDSRSL